MGLKKFKVQKVFLFLFFITTSSIAFCQEAETKNVVCHINLEEALQNPGAYNSIAIFVDHCDFETISKLSAFKNATSLTINSSAIDSLPFSFKELGKLTELQIINCPNLNYEKIWHIINGKNLVSLTITHSNIKHIPEAVFSFNNLTSLNISDNRIKEVPESVLFLKNLKQLGISQNKLKNIPLNLAVLNSLETLSLSNNGKLFKKVPIEKIDFSDSLKILYLQNTGIKKFPTSLQLLPNLKVLNLNYNSIEILPIELEGFRNLEILSIGGNKIKDIPISWKRIPFIFEVVLH